MRVWRSKETAELKIHHKRGRQHLQPALGDRAGAPLEDAMLTVEESWKKSTQKGRSPQRRWKLDDYEERKRTNKHEYKRG